MTLVKTLFPSADVSVSIGIVHDPLTVRQPFFQLPGVSPSIGEIRGLLTVTRILNCLSRL